MTDDPNHAIAIGRLQRLRRMTRIAAAASQGLHQDREEARQRATRSASDLRSAAKLLRYAGAEWDEKGCAIGLQTTSRQMANGRTDFDTARSPVPELDPHARRAKLDADKAEAARQLADAAAERWRGLSSVLASAEEFLASRGWLEADEPTVTGMGLSL